MPKAKKVNRRVKKDNILILLLTIILVCLVVWLFTMAKDIFKEKEPVKETKIVDEVKDYGYYLTDNNTDYYKSLYEELKKVLDEEELNDEKYAQCIAKLFTADFYDLNSKLSKNDVGGTQFLVSEYTDNFVKSANSYGGMYYYVESNLYGERRQELPKVKSIDIVSTKVTSYKHDKINDDKAYIVTLNVVYEKDLGYPKTVTVTLAHNNNRIEVVEVK